MTRSEIIKRLRTVSEELKALGTAIIAGQWADEMEKDNAVEGEHGS